MPILRGSITFTRFFAGAKEKSQDLARALPRGLKANAFEPIDKKGDDDRAAGFVELENADAADFTGSSLQYGERALFAYRVDQLKVPASQLRGELEAWQSAFHQENDRKPSRAEKAAAKAGFKQTHRNRAQPSTKVHDIAWNLKSGELQIWSSSRKTVDEIVMALEDACPVKLSSPLQEALARGKMDETKLQPTPELVGGEEVANGTA